MHMVTMRYLYYPRSILESRRNYASATELAALYVPVGMSENDLLYHIVGSSVWRDFSWINICKFLSNLEDCLMKTKKKSWKAVLSLMMSLVLMHGMLPATIFAADYTERTDSTLLPSSGTCKLTGNVGLPETISVRSVLVQNLNGFSITGTGGNLGAFNISSKFGTSFCSIIYL